MDNQESHLRERCYSCGENEPEYVLDDRPLCCKCYQREKKLAHGD